MAREADPSLNRRRLRIELRRAREEARRTQKEAADALEWSLSKLIRIEAGTVSVSITDLRALMQLYGITDPEQVEHLEESARGSKGQSWWAQYTDMIKPQFAQFLSYEGAAQEYRCFEPMLMPSMLQTTEYTDALLDPRRTTDTPRAIDLRLTRQERLFETDEGPEAEFVIGEAALHLQIGGKAVLRQQLQHLLDRDAHPRVNVRVLPYTAGAHFSTSTGFILLGFKDDDDLVYLQGVTGSAAVRSDVELTSSYRECFEDISMRSLAVDASADLIRAARDALSSS